MCSERKSLEEELHGRERVLEGLGRDLMRGLNSVKRITQEQQLEDKVGGVSWGWLGLVGAVGVGLLRGGRPALVGRVCG